MITALTRTVSRNSTTQRDVTLHEQDRIVADTALRLDALETTATQIRVARSREGRLRRALLAAAFSGRLTGRSSDLDIAEEMALA